MTVYIDKDLRCHTQNDGTMREIEAHFFDGKCPEFIEGYRLIPDGETWTREDGEEFVGEMAAPWKDYSQLSACQSVYERMLARQEDMKSALDAIFGGETDD